MSTLYISLFADWLNATSKSRWLFPPTRIATHSCYPMTQSCDLAHGSIQCSRMPSDPLHRSILKYYRTPNTSLCQLGFLWCKCNTILRLEVNRMSKGRQHHSPSSSSPRSSEQMKTHLCLVEKRWWTKRIYRNKPLDAPLGSSWRQVAGSNNDRMGCDTNQSCCPRWKNKTFGQSYTCDRHEQQSETYHVLARHLGVCFWRAPMLVGTTPVWSYVCSHQ